MALSREYIRKIEYYIANIPRRMYKPVGELAFEGFFTYDRFRLDEAKKQERKPLPQGMSWGRKWEYGWFFSTITVPECCEEERLVFAAKQGESVVFVNGEVVGAFDKEHTHITLAHQAKAGEQFEIAMEVYAGHAEDYDNLLTRDNVRTVWPEEAQTEEFPEHIPQRTVVNGTFGIFYEEVFQLWMDIKTLYDLRKHLDDQSLRQAKIDKALMQMCDAVDLELPMAEFLAAVQMGRDILRPELDCKNGSTVPTTYAIGHSHLDLQWLWTTEETRRKAARTLGNQLKLMEEYPEYKYIQSQPWILATVKAEYPALYARIKKAVERGSMIVEGGMWVESDTNLLSGESLIRQFIKGKTFIRDEFGVDSKIFWLPDSFGMVGSLPQIMKGCGIRYFLNNKIMWQYNDGAEIPHSNFMWRGIDGTEILTHLSVGYACDMNPSSVLYKWNINKEKAEIPISLIEFGHGDGGGGATRIHLEHLKREENLEGMPKVVAQSPLAFFERMEKECEVKETVVGELYYAAHRGSYTTQAKTKKCLRRSELALREAELWSAFLGENTKFETDACWDTVLFHQFHDIVPGTSLTQVHDKTEAELTRVIGMAESVVDRAVVSVTAHNNDCITVFNSLPWEREVTLSLPEGYTSVENGRSQRVGDRVLAQISVPPCGYVSYKMGTDAVAEQATNEELILENALIRAEFNARGELVSLTDKLTGREMLSKPSNRFRMYRDMSFFFDAWDIDSYYENQEVALVSDAEVSVEYKGSVESCILIKRKINQSCLTQRVILRNNSRRLDFETEVDWRETHKLLKVDFNTNICTDEMLSEIPFGYAKRPNHKSRQYDADRFEVCNHKWSALCEGKRGMAVLNDGKYGISADGGTMSLTLLRATTSPAKFADKGVHRFTYSILPFSESFAESAVIEEGYALNCPAVIKQGFAGKQSFIRVSEKNIVVDTVKYAQDGSGDIVIRMYEGKGMHTECKVHFGFDAKRVSVTNMLEQDPVGVDVDANEIALPFRAFEIITVRITV